MADSEAGRVVDVEGRVVDGEGRVADSEGRQLPSHHLRGEEGSAVCTHTVSGMKEILNDS